MSQQGTPLGPEHETPKGETEPHGERRSLAQRPREDGVDGERGEFVVIDEDTRLSADQRRTAHELLRLFHSLCGGQPGQYWPQALLDTAGHFNRPAFPQRRSARKE
jgi:hypothetical protein